MKVEIHIDAELFMNLDLEEQLTHLKESKTHLHLTSVLHGIEKEGLRVTPDGQLSDNRHPESLGSSLTNGSVTTDYSESQLELITPVFEKVEDSLNYLQHVHQFTYTHLEEELIWAGSMPCSIEDPAKINLAEFGTSNAGKMKHIYRVGLKHRYGSMMQSIAGIHYNFSLPEIFWKELQVQKKNLDTLEKFRSASYFTLIRNFRRHSWLLLYLFGASPALNSSFLKGKDHNLEELHHNTLFLPFATSLRMSDLGYSTSAQSSLKICFNHLETFVRSLLTAIHTPYPEYQKIGVKVDGEYRQLADTILQIENEYYSDIRPKRVPRPHETSLQALMRGGVEYIEVRNSDLNPFLPLGMDEPQALFLDVFLLTCLFMNNALLTDEECKQAVENHSRITLRGREPGLKLLVPKEEIDIKKAGKILFHDLATTASLFDSLHSTKKYTEAVKLQAAKLDDPSLTPSAMVLEELNSTGLEYQEWIRMKSEEHKGSLSGMEFDKGIMDHLEEVAQRSIFEQEQMEKSDTVSFDEYLRTARTGSSE